MKLTDYIADFLIKEGIGHVFGLTGGAVVHLFDSLDRNPGIKPVFMHHEQAAAFAAEAYSRVTNRLGAAFVTTGPGGTNAITGVAAAWLDSIPCIYISGQSRIEHTSRGKPLRQVGSQELDILPLVSSITKYAVMIDDPKRIRYHLEKAVYLAKSGRPGPVWLDIPLNFQWLSVDPGELIGFDPNEVKDQSCREQHIQDKIRQCRDLILASKRPLVLAGYGIRLAGAVSQFKLFVESLGIPFVTTWNTSDIYPSDNRLNMGRPGIFGNRGANLAVQNCDLLLSLGSHLSTSVTGTLAKSFARGAKIVMVDIDKAELDYAQVRVDLPVCADVKIFLEEMLKHGKELRISGIGHWQDKCLAYKHKYNESASFPKRKRNKYVDVYSFLGRLSDELEEEEIVVVDGGGTVIQTSFGGIRTKKGQRLFSSAGLSAMGSGIPESIGACFASGKKRVICLCGDGSMQLNVQEMETIRYHRLPIKIFLFNNQGYLAIRHTQDWFLEQNHAGSDKSGGLTLPDFKKVAAAYGIPAIKIGSEREMGRKIRYALDREGPVLCELIIPPDQQVTPRQGFRRKEDGTYAARPLEDMHPLLDPHELYENMVIPPWEN